MSDLDTAVSKIRGWYYSEISSLVDSAITECNEANASIEDGVTVREYDESTLREWLTEWVDQATDDHHIVIYTFKAKCACLASDNEDAYSDEIGEPPPSVAAQACMAMRADVWELLNARSDEWIPTEEETDNA